MKKKINWKKIIGWGVAALVLAGIIMTNVYQAKKDEKGDRPIIKIGAIVPLTGPLADYGKAAQKAAKIFIDDFNSKNPNRKYDYKIVFEDVEYSTAKALSATQKLISLDKVSAVTTLFSAMAIAIAPIAKREKILNFAYGADPRASDGEYSFRIAANPEDVGEMQAKKLKENNMHRISMITQYDDAGCVVRADFIMKAIKKNGLTLTGKHEVFSKDKDFTAILLKIKDENPDVIVLTSYTGIPDLLLIRMKRLGIDIPVVGSGIVICLHDKTLAEGSWCADESLPNAEFVEKMGSKNTFFGEFLYTELQVITNAFENTPMHNGQQPDMDLIVKTLYQTTPGMKTPFGSIDLDKNGAIFIPAVYKTIRNGKVELLEE